MTSRNRRASNGHPLYALLEGPARNDASSVDWLRMNSSCLKTSKDAGAKHRAAWRSNAAAGNQKTFRGF